VAIQEKGVGMPCFSFAAFGKRELNNTKAVRSEGAKMPYKSLEDLPERVKENLPHHAQEIYMEAFNSAWEQYKEPEERRGKESREEAAHKVAWSAVKKKYEKSEKGEWVEKKIA